MQIEYKVFAQQFWGTPNKSNCILFQFMPKRKSQEMHIQIISKNIYVYANTYKYTYVYGFGPLVPCFQHTNFSKPDLHMQTEIQHVVRCRYCI